MDRRPQSRACRTAVRAMLALAVASVLAPAARAQSPAGERFDARASLAQRDAPASVRPAASVSDGDGGILVLRHQFTFDGHPRFVIHRIGAMGQNLWGAEGVAVTTAGAVSSWPLMLEDGQGGAFLAWSDDADTPNVRLVRAQHVGADGTLRWPSAGVRFVSDTTGQIPIAVAPDGDGGLFVLWEQLERTFENPLMLGRVATGGTLPWAPRPAVPGLRLRASMVADGEGGVLVGYPQYDETSESYLLKLLRLDALGAPLWPDTSRTIGSCAGADSPSLTSDGAGGAFVVRNLGYLAAPSVQRVAADGEFAWGEGGIALPEMQPYGTSASVLGDHAGGVIVITSVHYSQATWYQTQCTLQRLGPGGTRLWPSAGIALAESTSDARLHACADGTGGLVLGWTSGNDQRNALRLQRVDAMGVLRWGDHGMPFEDRPGRRVLRDVRAAGDGGVVLGWDDGRTSTPFELPYGEYDPYAQRLSSDGAPLWGSDGVCVYANPTGQSDPLVLPAPDGSMVIWHEKRGATMMLLARRLDRAGAPRSSIVTVSPSGGTRGTVAAAPDGAGGAVLAWVDTHAGDVTIRAQRLDHDNVMRWGPDGVLLQVTEGDGAETAIAGTADGGALVAWLDQRDGRATAHAQHVGADGAVSWSPGGALVSTSTEWKRLPAVFAAPSGGGHVTWSERGAPAWGTFAQRLDASGATLWTPAAVRVGGSTEVDGMGPLALAADGEDGLYLARGSVRVQRLDPSGAPLWPGDGVPLQWSVPGQRMRLAAIPTGGVYATWLESDGVDRHNVFAARLEANGHVVRAGGTGILAAGVDPWSTDALAVPDSTGAAIVIWQVTANPFNPIYASEVPLRAQRVDWDGAVVWAEGGVTLRESAAAVSGLSACPDGTGGAYAAWHERLPDWSRRIRLQHVTADGSVEWGADGLTLGVTPIETPPLAGTLLGIRPSPAHGPFTVSFALAEGAPARLEVFDIGGRRVDERALDGFAPGSHALTLGGTRPLRPGLYLVSLAQGGHRETRRLVVLR